MILNEKRRRRLFELGGQYHLFRDKGFTGFVRGHSHTFYQFNIIEQGCISWRYDGETRRQHQGEVLFSPPGAEHSLFVFDNDTVYYTLSFSREVLEMVLGSAADVDGVLGRTLMLPLPSAGREQLLKLLSLLMDYPEHTQAGVLTPGCCLCAAAVLVFWGIAEHGAARSAQGEAAGCSEAPIARIQGYIDRHYCEDLSVDQLIAMSQFTKTAFFTHFREATGVTPKQYITEKRMCRAVELIQDTDLPFCQIAEEVGYHDFSTFFKNFCRMSACSPTEYREKFRRNQKEHGIWSGEGMGVK